MQELHFKCLGPDRSAGSPPGPKPMQVPPGFPDPPARGTQDPLPPARRGLGGTALLLFLVAFAVLFVWNIWLTSQNVSSRRIQAAAGGGGSPEALPGSARQPEPAYQSPGSLEARYPAPGAAGYAGTSRPPESPGRPGSSGTAGASGSAGRSGQDGGDAAHSGNGASPAGEPDGAGAADPPLTAPREARPALPAELFVMPSGGAKSLSPDEHRWCSREKVRADLLARFAQVGSYPSAAIASDTQYRVRCSEAETGERPVLQDLLAPDSRLGIKVVREVLDEAWSANPRLVMREPDPAALPPGMSLAPTLGEAQAILRVLGLDPGQADGGDRLATASAIGTFQRDLGLPETGELDRRTGALLRSAVFRNSLEPFRE